jgi:LmbE family N-acetylglucosaminyl deacetylase
MVIQSPDRNWDHLIASHPDHMAAGEAAIQAVYPDSRNAFAFEDLRKIEGLQPWRVKEVWIMSHQNPDHFVDITTTFDKKIMALKSHVSQTAHNENLEKMVRAWGERNAATNNLPAGSVAEVFKIVNTN